MEYQKFLPEGWEKPFEPVTWGKLQNACKMGSILHGMVVNCDTNYNLYVDLGNQIQGVIPREEVEAIHIDETGFPKPNICAGKVNQMVQFKVKDCKEAEHRVILSRKAVGAEAIKWVKEELVEGMIVKRNCKKY